MAQATLDMPKKSGGQDRRGPGRPKGSGPGRIEGRFAVKTTVEYRAWMAAFAEKKGITEADLFRAAMVHFAVAEGFRLPPPR